MRGESSWQRRECRQNVWKSHDVDGGARGRAQPRNTRNSGFLETRVSKYEVVRDENKKADKVVCAQLRSLDLIQLISH